MKKNNFYVKEIRSSLIFITLFFISPHLIAQYTITYDLKTVKEGLGVKGEEKLHNTFERLAMKQIEKDESYSIKVQQNGEQEVTILINKTTEFSEKDNMPVKTVIDGKSIKGYDKNGKLIFQINHTSEVLNLMEEMKTQTTKLGFNTEIDKIDKIKAEADDFILKGAKSKKLIDGTIHMRNQNIEYLQDNKNLRFEKREFEGKDLKYGYHQKFQMDKLGNVIPEYTREIQMDRNKQGNRVWHFNHNYYSNYKISKPVGFRTNNENTNAVDNFNIYPNPAVRQISIQLPLSILENSDGLSIIDMLGKEVFQQKITRQYETIELENLPNGTYLIQLKTLSGEKFTQRFTKQ